jgi:hypothetical protein
MDRLVMNFLVTEGFVDAADRFRLESGTQSMYRTPCLDAAYIEPQTYFSLIENWTLK